MDTEANFFRATLADLKFSQSDFARELTRLGAPRPPSTVLRSVQRMANGENKVSAEMHVLLRLLRQHRLNTQTIAALESGMRSHENTVAGQVDTTDRSIGRFETYNRENETAAGIVLKTMKPE